MRRRLQLITFLSLSAALAGTSDLPAQVVRGRLLDQVTRRSIDHAFVVLIDSAGVEVSRSITDNNGLFTFAAPSPGNYAIRTERIGFMSIKADLGILDAGETREIDIHVEPVVIHLDSITVTGDASECRVQGEQGLATATVWEEARKVLAAVAWGESQRLFIYHTSTYQRWLDRRARVVQEADSMHLGDRVVLFRSLPARELQEHGYASIRPDSFVYYVPDAATFFSDEFLSHHCFSLQRNHDYPDMIGLAFEPITARDVPDVHGVLWLDESSAELRQMDVKYQNLGSQQLERHAEGRVVFDRLPGGPWFVSEWWIRMPLLSFSLPALAYRPIETLAGFKEDGGRVLLVKDWNRVVVWERR
jgi:hypothetical protein